MEDALLLLPAADYLGATYFLQKCSKSLAQPQGLGVRLRPDTNSFPIQDNRWAPFRHLRRLTAKAVAEGLQLD